MSADRQMGRPRARIARFATSLAASVFMGFCTTAPASGQVSFTRAWGWGVADGQSRFETCTTACEAGLGGGGAGEINGTDGLAVGDSGDVFLADSLEARVDEFSSAGAFIKALGWGVADGASRLEACTDTCRSGLEGGGAGQFFAPRAVAVDGVGDVFVADSANERIDEFSSAGAFIKAWGWGVADGAGRLETCTIVCESGLSGGGAGEFDQPDGVAVDGAGDVFVVELFGERVDEFSSAGAFVKAWGWGVADGQRRFETCTTTCQRGLLGSGAGQLYHPYGLAVGAGDVFVADTANGRIDEFSLAGGFVKAWGWGVADGQTRFETCTTSCRRGRKGNAIATGLLYAPEGVAVDGSGDVFVADSLTDEIDEFSSTGAFALTWGWGAVSGHDQLETCTTATTCRGGNDGGGAGELSSPDAVAVDGSRDVFVGDDMNSRLDEFRVASSAQTTPPGSTGGRSTCATAKLRLTFVDTQAAAGQRYVDYALTNAGARTCSLRGYATAVLLNRQGQVIHSAHAKVGHSPASPVRTVTIGPRKRAFFSFIWGDGGFCPGNAFTFYGLRVSPPNNATGFRPHLGKTTACDASARVSAVRPKRFPF